MAEVDTEKLQALEDNAEGAPVTAKTDPLAGMPPLVRSLIVLLLGSVLGVSGGAAGQSMFGVSEERLDSQFEAQEKSIIEKIQGSENNINNKIEIIRLQNDNSDRLITTNAAAIADATKRLRDVERRMTRLEAKTGGD